MIILNSYIMVGVNWLGERYRYVFIIRRGVGMGSRGNTCHTMLETMEELAVLVIVC